MSRVLGGMTSLVVLASLLTAALLPMVPDAAALNDPPDNQSSNNLYVPWTVTDTREYTRGTKITMWNQNVVVKNGGTLILDASSLIFCPAGYGSRGLLVESGGTFIMRNGSAMATGNSTGYSCRFDAGSNVSIRDSSVGNAYYNDGLLGVMGIRVASGNATMERSAFRNNSAGQSLVTVVLGGGLKAGNSTFTTLSGNAVEAVLGGRAALYDCVINDLGNTRAGACGFYGELEIFDCDIGNCVDGIRSTGSQLTAKGSNIHDCTNGLYLYSSDAELVGNAICNNLNAIDAELRCDIEMRGGNRIYNDRRGVLLDQKSTLDSSSDTFEALGGAVMEVDNSDVNIRGAKFLGDGGNIINSTDGSNLTVTDSSFQKKPGGSFDYDYAVRGYLGCSALLERCTFTDVSILGEVVYGSRMKMTDSTVNSMDYGFDVYEDSELESSGNTYKGGEAVFGLWEHSAGTSTGDRWDTAAQYSSMLYVDVNSTFVARGFKGNGGTNARLAECYDFSSFEFIDSQFKAQSSPNLLLVNEFSSVRSIGSSLKANDTIRTYWGSTVEIGWHADLRAEWPNGAPAAGALVSYRDATGKLGGSLVMDGSGRGRVDLIQTTISQETGTVGHDPYAFNAELDGMTGNASRNMTGDMLEPEPVVITMNDTALPSIDITCPTEGWRTGSRSFVMNGTASDEGSGIARVQVSDGTGWKDATGTDEWEVELGLPEGTFGLEARVTDIAGNTASEMVNVTVDLTAPALAVTEPAGDHVTSGVFYVNGTSDGVGVTVDGEPAALADGNFSLLVNLWDGPHDIVVFALDDVGNEATATKHVVVDTIAPAVTCDVAGGTLVRTAALKLGGTSDGDLVTVNGTAAVLDGLTGTWSLDITLAEGENVLAIEASDLAGHRTAIEVAVTLDSIPPVLAVTGLNATAATSTNRRTYTVIGTVTGADNLTLDGAALGFDAGGSFSRDINLSEGRNILSFLARDAAGNQASAEYAIILDTKAPVIKINSPASGLVTNATTIDLMGEVDDITAVLARGNLSLTNANGTFRTSIVLSVGANNISVTATDPVGNTGTAMVVVTSDTIARYARTEPSKSPVKTSRDTINVSGTSEPGASVYINGVMIPVNADGSFSYQLVVFTGKAIVNIRVVDPAGNIATDSFTVERPAAVGGQDNAVPLMGLAAVLLVLGLVAGLGIGWMMGGSRKGAPPVEAMPVAPNEGSPQAVREPAPAPPPVPPPLPPAEPLKPSEPAGPR